MFLLTRNWLMVPQSLYCFLLLGGGALAAVSVGALVSGAARKRDPRYMARWSALAITGVVFLALTMTQTIVGHMMVGG